MDNLKLVYMNIIVPILVVIAALITLLCIIALFIPNDYTIEREIVINQPIEKVFNYVKHLKNQVNYNKWVMLDPNAIKEFRGTDTIVGFVMAWDSENKQVGKGEQEIINIVELAKVDCEIRFERPFKGKAFAS